MTGSREQTSFFSSFTLNIVFVVLIIVGAALMPLLSLQLNPTRYLPSLTISYSWPDAPARVAEQEVTSVLEGVLSTLPGVSRISSSTYNERGQIMVEFDKRADLHSKRFEVASLVREASKRLPERVSYPVITMNMPSNTQGSVILIYRITGNATPSYIFRLAEESLKPAIASVKGVYNVDVYGATPRTWEIVYDQKLTGTLGIPPSAIQRAINSYLSELEAGSGIEQPVGGDPHRTYITITGNNADSVRWEEIPVARSHGRIVMLPEIASVRLKDGRPRSYYRINGLNTITMVISAGKNVNNIRVANGVKEVVEDLKKKMPPGYDIIPSVDNTEFIRNEISKNLFRAVLSVVLLLCFVLLISREIKYLLIITISLIANIFIAFIFYYLFRLEVHLYSLAGITVSFGIIINNTIVMTDHLRYHHNRQVGISLLAATLTTVGALVVIFFLDEASKVTLTDFAAVVIINLMVSLAVALFFIPSLVGSVKLNESAAHPSMLRKRLAVRFTHFYEKFINFIIRFRVAFIIVAILVFGLPVFYLPDSLPKDKISGTQPPVLTDAQKLFNRTLGNQKFVSDVKPLINKILGGTFRLFNEKVKSNRYYYYGGSDDVQRTQLDVRIGLSEEGLTIEDINDVCSGLENMIAAFSEVDRFTTSVSSQSTAYMNITFRPEHDHTVFPYLLKARIEDYMNGIGSYHASVSGVGKAFSNQVYSDYIRGSYSIIMKGYNYDDLYGYADGLKERLMAGANGRIKEVFILGGTDRWYAKKQYRNVIAIDREYIAVAGSDIRDVYSQAHSYSLFSSGGGQVFISDFIAPLTVCSDLSEEYDYWNINNQSMVTPAGHVMKLKDFTTVTMEITDNTISREDQQYVLSVTYDFIGNPELGRIILDRNISGTKAMLPLGYTVRSEGYQYSWDQQKNNYPLLFLVVVIIYFICAVLLESLRQPLTVISLIPFSFIGVFITFSLFKLTPDEGVFAAMILLCGIVVNAALYILDDYNRLRRTGTRLPAVRLYLKAFNGKIIPVFLTILSTIIGLLPFLFTGKDERFWFALAAGTIGGLVLSLVGLLIYQPMMLARDVMKGIKMNKTSTDG